MERERLDRLIRDPQAVGGQDLSVLKDLVDRSPWFTGAHLLRAVGERSTGDVRSDQTLQHTAAHLPSRAVLYDLVERPSHTPVNVLAQPIRVVVDPADVEGSAVTDATVMLEEEVEAAPLESPPAHASATFVVAEAADVSPGAAVGSDPKDEPVSVAREDPLERQILEAAMASAYDLTLHAPSAPVTDPLKVVNDEVSAPPPPSPDPASPDAPVVSGAMRTPLASGARSRLRFTEWLADAVATTPAPSPVASVVRSAPVEGPIDERAPTSTVADKISVAPRDPERTRDLIDRFIQQETPVPVRKTEFFTPQQAAKRSLDDTTGMVTETLARIYEKQGNLQKAIEAYRKLALKYPEKSAYFAALSRSLEDQLNK